MSITTIAPVTRALVQALKDNVALKAALVGGIHEGLAPDATKWPFLIYFVHWSHYSYDWGGVTLKGIITLQVVSQDQVEARDLDSLVMTTLHDAALNVSEQTTLYCRRSSDVQSADVDGQGKKVYMVGGMYDIWTAQGLP